MPDDNPYAAPQTSNLPLPIAEGRETERRLYPELSSLELERLLKLSRMMLVMNALYGVILGLLVTMLSASLGRLGESPDHRRFVTLMLFSVVLPLGLRLWWATERRPWMRYAAMGFDVLVSFSLVLGIAYLLWLTWLGKLEIIVTSLIALLGIPLAVVVAKSFLVLKQGREVFAPEPYPFAMLSQEMAYRDRYDID